MEGSISLGRRRERGGKLRLDGGSERVRTGPLEPQLGSLGLTPAGTDAIGCLWSPPPGQPTHSQRYGTGVWPRVSKGGG